MVAWVALLYKVVANRNLRKFDKKIVHLLLLFHENPKDLLSSASCCCFVFVFFIEGVASSKLYHNLTLRIKHLSSIIYLFKQPLKSTVLNEIFERNLTLKLLFADVVFTTAPVTHIRKCS